MRGCAIEYASDGTTATSETLMRGTGTLELTRKRSADGTVETTRYRVDGKRMHSVSHELNGALVDATFYRQDGKTLWATAKSVSASESEVKFYNAAGQVEKIRLSKSTSGSYSGKLRNFRQRSARRFHDCLQAVLERLSEQLLSQPQPQDRRRVRSRRQSAPSAS